VFLWAFQSWYWARLMLDMTFGDRDAPPPEFKRLLAFINHTPRVLAAGSYLVALGGCLLAGRAAVWIGVALRFKRPFYAFLVIRRSKIVDKLVGVNPDGSPDWKQKAPPSAWRGSDEPPIACPCSRGYPMADARRRRGPDHLVCIDAVGFGWFFGAAAVALPRLFHARSRRQSSRAVGARGGAGRIVGDRLRLEDTAGYPVITLLLLLAPPLSFFPLARQSCGENPGGTGERGGSPKLDRC